MRALARFQNVYVVLPRGAAKTYCNVLMSCHEAIVYPTLRNSVTAESLKQAATILKDKWSDVTTHFPALKNEIIDTVFRGDQGELYWKNGSITDVLANSHRTKGLRRHRLRMEEAARLDDDLFQDALEPVANMPRLVIRDGESDPKELNGSIHFFTTSTYRGCDEHRRNERMISEMTQRKGSFVFGADWRMPVHFGMQNLNVIKKAKAGNNPINFAMNYGSEWVGASEGALLNMQLLINSRRKEIIGKNKKKERKFVIPCATLKPRKGVEYVFGVDIAKSKKDNYNKTIVTVIGFTRDKYGKVEEMWIEAMGNPPNGQTFESQSLFVKQWADIFKPTAVVIDAQSYGQGFLEACTKPTLNPLTGRNTEKWCSFDSWDGKPEYGRDVVQGGKPIMFELKSNGTLETSIIMNFQGLFSQGKVKLLCPHKDIIYTSEANENLRYRAEIEKAHIHVDEFINEVSNLKVVQNEKNKSRLSIERISRNTDKDRYSATAYALYYIKTYEDIEKMEDDPDDDYVYY